jgi:hypothetical protein
MKLKNIFLGWDFLVAVTGASVGGIFVPAWVANSFAKDIYEMGISVLSIVFAVFFTALAVIVSAGDDEFVWFLKQVKLYDRLVTSFRFTLWLLFVALLYAVACFTFTAACLSVEYKLQSKWLFVMFIFLFIYSMFATISSTQDAMSYARFRIEFLEIKKKSDPN